jgi:nitroreductase
MDAIEALMTTRAMRRFTADPVTDDEIWTCLRAAQQAPSGGNVQPQQYVVVTDAAKRDQIGELYRRSFDRYEKTLPAAGAFPDPETSKRWQRARDLSRHLADNFAAVPVHVFALQPLIPWGASDDEGPMDIGRLDASVYPAVQNFCVAARALGLGTALTTVIRLVAGEAFDVLDVPHGKYEIAALLPLGRPVGSFGIAPRKPVAKVTHWDSFGARRVAPPVAPAEQG